MFTPQIYPPHQFSKSQVNKLIVRRVNLCILHLYAVVLMVILTLLLEIVELRGLDGCLAHVCNCYVICYAVKLDDTLASAQYLQLLAVNIEERVLYAR